MRAAELEKSLQKARIVVVIILRDNERNVGIPWKAAVKLSRSSTWNPQLGFLRRRQEVGGNWYGRRWSVSKLASWLAARPPRCVHSTWLPWTRSKVDGVEASRHQHDHHLETSRTDLPHSTVQYCSRSVYKATRLRNDLLCVEWDVKLY